MVFYILLTVHLFVDFLFQDSFFSEKKKREWKVMIYHCVIYFLIFLLVFLLMVDCDYTFILVFIITFLHFLFLALKRELEKSFHRSKAYLYIFIINQLLHIAILFILYYFFDLKNNTSNFYKILESYKEFESIIKYLLLLIILLEPSSSLIQKILALSSFKKTERLKFSELRVGNMIGKLERLIIAVLLLNNQYGVIGLVLTAKSIARFKQMENKNFAEKYLVGTLASVFIVLITTLFIKSI